MSVEIEASFIEVDHDELRGKLRQFGAELVTAERLMRRTIFDYADLHLDKRAAWIRVRDEGDRVTVSYKQRQAETVEGMQEIELQINDYEAACQFFEAIDLKVKSAQESKRESWRFMECEVVLDTWPHIPSFVEIEGPSQEAVRAVAEKLGFDWESALFDSADAIYQRYFDVSRTEISSMPLVFGQIPAELEAKRRKVN